MVSGLAKTILQGRRRKRWEDNIREWTGLEFAKSQRAVENREKWRKLVAKSSVVPQRPLRLSNRWWWLCVCVFMCMCLCSILKPFIYDPLVEWSKPSKEKRSNPTETGEITNEQVACFFPFFAIIFFMLLLPVHSHKMLALHLLLWTFLIALPWRLVTVDAEIKDSSVENPEIEGAPCKAWSRSRYSPACFAYCQESLPC